MRAHPIAWGVLLCVFWGAARPAQADPLNVTDFDSLGEFPSGPGGYTINTSGDPTLTAPDGTAITGVVFDGIAVFAFDSITIGRGMTITAYGDRPLALLSYSDVIIWDTGAVRINGQNAQGTTPGEGGPGGGRGGVRDGPGQGPGGGGGSGGAGFGGHGGGSNGGRSYGDLTLKLEGGSGGGSGSGGIIFPSAAGGGGGGGIEIGALGGILIGDNGIQAMGGSGANGIAGRTSSAGGGSGGGIFLHGESVKLEGLLNAMGGAGAGGGTGGGGGGSGGQVLILTGHGGFWNNGEIDVSGGIGPGGNGDDGTITIGDLGPEPVTLGMGVLGALALLDFARRRRLRRLGPPESLRVFFKDSARVT